MPHVRPVRWIVSVALLAAGWRAAPAAAQLTVAGNYRVYQSEGGGLQEIGDRFGSALAAGDFNRDGYDDLAVGVPDEAVGDIDHAGAVYLFWGSDVGLGKGPLANRVLYQGFEGAGGAPAADDRFGQALAAGDFNGNGYFQLAVGVPGEEANAADAGAIHIYNGSAAGIANSSFSPHSFNPEANFGAALAVCDLDGDDQDDLVIGAPGPGPDDDTSRPGKIHIWPSASPGDEWAPAGEDGDRFGERIACGDLDGDGLDDLVANAPYGTGGGLVRVLPSTGAPVDQASPAGTELWGDALAVAHLRGPGAAKLVIGDPRFDSPGLSVTGRLLIGDYDDHPLDMVDLRQGDPRLGETLEPFDALGHALAVGDFDHDGFEDLAVGVPGEDLYDGTPGVLVGAGIVQITYGSAAGPHGLSTRTAIFNWDTIGFGALSDDLFGSPLAVGDFNRDGIDDLAIGAPFADWGGDGDVGIVQILHGSKPGWIFGDGFESGGVWKWSAGSV
jgi:hypothetical protein